MSLIFQAIPGVSQDVDIAAFENADYSLSRIVYNTDRRFGQSFYFEKRLSRANRRVKKAASYGFSSLMIEIEDLRPFSIFLDRSTFAAKF